jgi:hypothetical protein
MLVAEPYVPPGQGVHAADVAPPVEQEPTGQGPEQVASTWPVTLPKVPAGRACRQPSVAPPVE